MALTTDQQTQVTNLQNIVAAMRDFVYGGSQGTLTNFGNGAFFFEQFKQIDAVVTALQNS